MPSRGRVCRGYAVALPRPWLSGSAAAALGAARDHGAQVIAVHPGDRIDADLLRTGVLAFAEQGAVAEMLAVHLRDHAERSAAALGLALRQRSQMSQFRGRKE